MKSFMAWKVKFDKEIALKRAQEDEEKLKGATPKEREEWKKIGTRLSGKDSSPKCEALLTRVCRTAVV